jgi:hypothetical protein
MEPDPAMQSAVFTKWSKAGSLGVAIREIMRITDALSGIPKFLRKSESQPGE